MELSDRETTILQAVVHIYITTAEPVGSRTIVKRSDLGWSPATVRNVMADLEEAGYLEQLHTSSGRVPTDKGYRYYVDYLMRIQELTLVERSRIEEQLSDRLNDADDVMRRTSRLLALVSHHTGLAEAPDEKEAMVRSIELVPMGGGRMAVMVVDSYGRVRTLMVSADQAGAPQELNRLRTYLNEHLRGVSVDQMGLRVRERAQTVMDENRRLAGCAADIIAPFQDRRPGVLFFDGATHLFEQPEFHDVDKAREVFDLLGEQDNLVALLRSGFQQNPGGTMVLIGSESSEKRLSDISMVLSPYYVAGKPAGLVGVLGPKRMPYSKLTALVDYTAGFVSRLLTRLAG
jgi:heat-inducible transcriptional repressor